MKGRKLKILNSYAGIGGNRKLWQDVEVTAVEHREDIAAVYRHYFPQDKIVIADAHQYLLDHYQEFDVIWSSPPCQSHSRMVKFTRHNNAGYIDMSLYEEIIFLTHFFNGLWVVENVRPYYDPLILPTAILGRHYFWSNFKISQFEMEQPKNFDKLTTTQGKKVMMDWLGLHFEENIYYNGNHCPVQILRNCVHPETGLHILNCALNKFSDKRMQGSLFESFNSENLK